MAGKAGVNVAERRSLRDQLARRCKYFTGVQHDTCKVGVEYSKVRIQYPTRPSRLPCLRLDAHPLPPCSERCFPTDEEVEAEDLTWKRELSAHFAKLEQGICPTCGGKLEPRRQVGRCAYGACGHRIGQTEGR